MAMNGKLNEIQVLLLSVDGSRYGIDIDQIAGLMNYNAAGPAVGFAQLMGAGNLAEAHCSKMLIVKHMEQLAVLINEPDEVATVLVRDILRLPAVLHRTAGSKGVWGLWPQAPRQLTLLVDFHKNQLFRQLAGNMDHRL